MASKLGMSQRTVIDGLKKLDKVQKLGRWIPHALSQFDLKRRVDECSQLLTRERNFAWMNDLDTGDENWIFYSTTRRRPQWVSKAEEPEPVFKPEFHAKKVMLCVWWSKKGIEYWELLSHGQAITSDVYSRQLQKLKSQLELTRSKERRDYFLHGNARPHVENSVMFKRLTFGWQVIPHPPYSSDLAPSNY